MIAPRGFVFLAALLLAPTLASAASEPPKLFESAPPPDGGDSSYPAVMCSPLRYPSDALRNAGYYELVDLSVAADGAVRDAKIVQGVNVPDVDRVSLACAMDLTFIPARADGKAVADHIKIYVRWPHVGAATVVTAQANGSTPVPKPALTAPAAIGRPHFCFPGRYPIGALITNAQGETKLTFTIDATGQVQDIRILQSSGNEELDRASKACSRAWLYRPAVQDGTPVAVPWKTNVRWNIPDSDDPTATFPKAEGPAPACDKAPGGAIRDPAVVFFTISTLGDVSDVSLEQSSGNAFYDNYAKTCVAKWKFTPQQKNGEAVPTLTYAVVQR